MQDKTTREAVQDTLTDRMKSYETVTTERILMPNAPICVRLDMRAGHTFVRGLGHLNEDFAYAMGSATAYLVRHTGALLGYCQSDECNLCYADSAKMPFGERLFKIESVFASMFTAAFMRACLDRSALSTKIVSGPLPNFDCRAFNVPSRLELAHMILWRSRSCLRSAISLSAERFYTKYDLSNKNSVDKLVLMARKGFDFDKEVPEYLRIGQFWRREPYERILSADELAKFPKENWPEADADGCYRVTRSRVVPFEIGMHLDAVYNLAEVLFDRKEPIEKQRFTKETA